MTNIFAWNPEIAAAANVPVDFDPGDGALTMLEHELPALTEAEVAKLRSTRKGEEALADYLLQRHERVYRAWKDPYHHGWELPHWPIVRDYFQTRDEIYVFGANDSAKTKFLARIVVNVLMRRIRWPGIKEGPVKVLCIAQNDTVSKQIQQSAIYEELPKELRIWNESGKKRRSALMKLNYSQADGFTGAGFVLGHPRGSQCWFRNVSQWSHGELSFEGAAYHLVAIDEDLPLGMLEALQFRAGKVGGKILYCFTSVQGFNSICKNVLTGAAMVQSLPMQHQWLKPVSLTPK